MSASDIIRHWYDQLENTDLAMPAALVGTQAGEAGVPPVCVYGSMLLVAAAWPNTGPGSDDYPGTGLASLYTVSLLFSDRMSYKSPSQPLGYDRPDQANVRLRLLEGDLVLQNLTWQSWSDHTLQEAGDEILSAVGGSIGNKQHHVTWFVLLSTELIRVPG